MYNMLYEFVIQNETLYGKEIPGFSLCRVSHLRACYYKYLSKAFYTVDHTILLNKLNQYGIKTKYCDFFKCCLNNRKELISYGEENTYLETVKCCFPLGSIIGLLLFLIFLKDLQYAANMLNPVKFAETQVFFTLMVA